jgi:hypothetical protein
MGAVEYSNWLQTSQIRLVRDAAARQMRSHIPAVVEQGHHKHQMITDLASPRSYDLALFRRGEVAPIAESTGRSDDPPQPWNLALSRNKAQRILDARRRGGAR